MTSEPFDVLVVGGGIAGLSAALAAREAGASVRLLERAPKSERGGNTRFSNGALRAVYRDVGDIRRLLPDLRADIAARTDFGTYPRERYLADFARVTEGRTDPMLSRVVVDKSFEVLCWLMTCGVRYDPLWSAQAPAVNGHVTFYGGSAVEARGLGTGLVDVLYDTLEARGGVVSYDARAVALLQSGGGVCGASVRGRSGETYDVMARSVVLSSGGFESDVEWRTRYLGPGWDLASVRGTRFNGGDGLRMALDAGAQPYGQWSGCHAASWACHAPRYGDPALDEKFKRDDFMHGIFVNAHGRRFVDEGADLRALTYAKYGRAVMEQPGSVAWQIFDAKTVPLLSDDYRHSSVAPIRADTLEELARCLPGVNGAEFLETVRLYNAAVRTDVPHDPSRKDGLLFRNPIGRRRSIGRRSRCIRSRSASRSLSAAFVSTPMPACSMPKAPSFLDSTPPARWSEAFFTSTIPAARGWYRQRSSDISPAAARQRPVTRGIDENVQDCGNSRRRYRR
jgi:tricarballylate dehydrogenase